MFVGVLYSCALMGLWCSGHYGQRGRSDSAGRWADQAGGDQVSCEALAKLAMLPTQKGYSARFHLHVYPMYAAASTKMGS